LKGQIVGITGSNGKTTTTTLIGENFEKRRNRNASSAEISELPLSI
jgi:UDP-N-acetylmuramoylalanine-D-glutamate ligase